MDAEAAGPDWFQGNGRDSSEMGHVQGSRDPDIDAVRDGKDGDGDSDGSFSEEDHVDYKILRSGFLVDDHDDDDDNDNSNGVPNKIHESSSGEDGHLPPPPPSTTEREQPTPADAEEEEEEKQCRICLGGVEDEEELGRLISPCLCRGSIRHVHVKCINRWRGSGGNSKAYLHCTQCGFRYRLRRTLILGLASSRIILFTTSFLIFLSLALGTGSILHWMLHFKRFRRLITGPFGDDAYIAGEGLPVGLNRNNGMGLGVGLGQNGENVDAYQDPFGSAIGVRLPGGFTYISTSSGVMELIVKSIRAFTNGEAQDVLLGIVDLIGRGWSKLFVRGGTKRRMAAKMPSLITKAFHRLSALVSIITQRIPLRIPHFLTSIISPLLTRLSLGLSLIGSASFVTFLISTSLMAPFQLANNLRFGGGGRGLFGFSVGGAERRGGGRGRGVGDGTAALGLGSAIVVLFVVMGAVRVIRQLYGLTQEISQILLTKAETAILEVNPRGELIASHLEQK